MAILEALYDIPRLTLTSLSFLLILLPVMLGAYYLLPVKARAGGLFVLSLGCYYLAEGYVRLLLLAGCIAVDYAVIRLLGLLRGRRGLRLLLAAAAVTKSVFLIAWFGALEGIVPILGLTIYPLASMGVVLLAYQGKLPPRQDPFVFGLCCAFFPALYAGPLAVYETFAKEAGLNLRAVFTGFGRVAVGAFKAAVIGGSMYRLYGEILAMERADPGSAGTLSAWCVILTAAFALYYGLSGLSDMAQGIGMAFGFTLPKNFYYPYQSRSVEDFFERFHSAVYRFLREFAAVVPEKYGAAGDAVNIVLASALWGLWFGLTLQNLLWGGYFALFVLMERYLYDDILKRTPLLFRRIGTLLVVLGGFAIFVGGTPDGGIELTRRMFHYYAPASDQILYLLSSNWLVLAAACLFATNVWGLLAAQFRKAAPRLSPFVLGAVNIALFALFIALTY